MVGPRNIGVVLPAHGHLLVVSVHAAPQQHTAVGQHGFLFVGGKVFEDHISVRVHRFDVVVIVGEDVDTALVVSTPGTDVFPAVFLGESFRKVNPESVNPEFGEPVAEHILEKLACVRTFVVEVVAYAERMRRLWVQPWI
jgi:hypothetical protein